MFSDFKIKPYLSAGPIALGISRAQLHTLLGAPSASRIGKFSGNLIDIWDAEGISITMKDNEVVEIGFGSEQSTAQIEGFRIFGLSGPATHEILCFKDGRPLADAGFTVLLNLGITLSGFLNEDQDERAVTVFKEGLWRADDESLEPIEI